MHLAILLFLGIVTEVTETATPLSEFEIFMDCSSCTFHISTATVRQMTVAVQSADRLLQTPYSLSLQAHSRLPPAPLKSHTLFLLPSLRMGKTSSNKPAHYFLPITSASA